MMFGVPVSEDIRSIEFKAIDTETNIFFLTLKFKDGEESTVTLTRDQNQGSALPTPAQRVAAQYAHIADFLLMFTDKVEFSEETKSTINLVMRYTNKKEI